MQGTESKCDPKPPSINKLLEWFYLPERIDAELTQLIEQKCTRNEFYKAFSHHPEAFGLYGRGFVRALLKGPTPRLDILEDILELNYGKTHRIYGFYDILRIAVEEFDNVEAAELIINWFHAKRIRFTSFWAYGVSFAHSPFCFEAFARSTSIAPLDHNAIIRYIATNLPASIRHVAMVRSDLVTDEADYWRNVLREPYQTFAMHHFHGESFTQHQSYLALISGTTRESQAYVSDVLHEFYVEGDMRNLRQFLAFFFRRHRQQQREGEGRYGEEEEEEEEQVEKKARQPAFDSNGDGDNEDDNAISDACSSAQSRTYAYVDDESRAFCHHIAFETWRKLKLVAVKPMNFITPKAKDDIEFIFMHIFAPCQNEMLQQQQASATGQRNAHKTSSTVHCTSSALYSNHDGTCIIDSSASSSPSLFSAEWPAGDICDILTIASQCSSPLIAEYALKTCIPGYEFGTKGRLNSSPMQYFLTKIPTLTGSIFKRLVKAGAPIRAFSNNRFVLADLNVEELEEVIDVALEEEEEEAKKENNGNGTNKPSKQPMTCMEGKENNGSDKSQQNKQPMTCMEKKDERQRLGVTAFLQHARAVHAVKIKRNDKKSSARSSSLFFSSSSSSALSSPSSSPLLQTFSPYRYTEVEVEVLVLNPKLLGWAYQHGVAPSAISSSGPHNFATSSLYHEAVLYYLYPQHLVTLCHHRIGYVPPLPSRLSVSSTSTTTSTSTTSTSISASASSAAGTYASTADLISKEELAYFSRVPVKARAAPQLTLSKGCPDWQANHAEFHMFDRCDGPGVGLTSKLYGRSYLAPYLVEEVGLLHALHQELKKVHEELVGTLSKEELEEEEVEGGMKDIPNWLKHLQYVMYLLAISRREYHTLGKVCSLLLRHGPSIYPLLSSALDDLSSLSSLSSVSSSSTSSSSSSSSTSQLMITESGPNKWFLSSSEKGYPISLFYLPGAVELMDKTIFEIVSSTSLPFEVETVELKGRPRDNEPLMASAKQTPFPVCCNIPFLLSDKKSFPYADDSSYPAAFMQVARDGIYRAGLWHRVLSLLKSNASRFDSASSGDGCTILMRLLQEPKVFPSYQYHADRHAETMTHDILSMNYQDLVALRPEMLVLLIEAGWEQICGETKSKWKKNENKASG